MKLFHQALLLFAVLIKWSIAYPQECLLMGHWINEGVAMTINHDMTGTRDLCGGTTITVDVRTGNYFHIYMVPAPGSLCLPAEEDMTFSNCDFASGTGHNDPSTGVGPIDMSRTGGRLYLFAQPSRIPLDSIINGKAGGALLHSDMSLHFVNQPNGGAGQTANLISDTSGDVITQASSSDFAGYSTASVETRSKAANISMIESTTTDAAMSEQYPISWLPAYYENDFDVSCYVSAKESDYINQPIENYNLDGLPPNTPFHHGFPEKVRSFGSGETLTAGSWLQYDYVSARYHMDTCPRTASTRCAVDNGSVAADKSVVPKNSKLTISVGGTNLWSVDDVGQRINHFSLDLYFGERLQDCQSFGRQTGTVTLQSY